jgi:hypothetical protein
MIINAGPDRIALKKNTITVPFLLMQVKVYYHGVYYFFIKAPSGNHLNKLSRQKCKEATFKNVPVTFKSKILSYV